MNLVAWCSTLNPIMKKSKYSKFNKLGYNMNPMRLREIMREHRRRQEFIGRLQKGDKWNKTDDPGPW